MTAEIGHLALWLALGLALALGVLPLARTLRGRGDRMATARPLAVLLFVATGVSFACLAASFVGNDFSVLYVAAHSNSALPLAHRAAGVWGGHEGSLLLWVLMLGAGPVRWPASAAACRSRWWRASWRPCWAASSTRNGHAGPGPGRWPPACS